MQRETKEFITPNGIKTVIQAWLIGSERRAIDQFMLKNGIRAGNDGSPQNLTADNGSAFQDLVWKMIIVSINDQKENIVESMLAMRDTDYASINNEVNRIIIGEATEEKKTT